MSKIGLQITACQEGFRSGDPFNGDGSWENTCIDIRTSILSRYEYDYAAKYGVFMRFSKQGSYITIWKFLSASKNDFTAAWLFIPSGTKIEGKAVLDLINKVKDALPTLHKEQTQKQIKELFSQEYVTDEYSPEPIESNEKLTSGAKLAFRKYKDENELADLIGNKRCQPYYEDYTAILLTGPNGLQLKSPIDITDLTRKKLVEYAMLPIPQKLNEQGIRVFIDNSESEYTQKQKFEIGSEIKLTFKKDDREAINRDKVKFDEPDKFWERAAADLKWEKKITRDMFLITAKTKVGNEDKASECVIKINGKELTTKGVLIPEDELSEVRVEITLKHFEAHSNKHDLDQKTINIQMSEEKKYTHSEYQQLEKKLEKKGKEISDKQEKINKLEKDLQKTKEVIEGLEKELEEKEEKEKDGSYKPEEAVEIVANKPDDGDNKPEETTHSKNSRGKKKAGKICLIIWAAVSTVIAIALAIVLLSGKTLHDLTSVFSNDNATATATLQTEPAATAEITDSIPAINYLKNCNGILFRDSLEHYSFTKGLWDDLNDFNLEKVSSVWAAKLRGIGIQYFEDIAEHAKNCIDKNLLDKAKEKNSGHYNKAEDLKINVKNYCNWIDAACDKNTSSNDSEDKYGSGN